MIALRQYQKIYNKHLLSLLKEGRIPTFEEVVSRAGNELPSPDKTAGPIYKYLPQTAKSVFDIDNYNRAISQIKTDLEVIFEELNDIEINNIQRILHAELFNAVHSYELAKLSKQLDAILFATQGAEENFFADFDTFKDTSKTDLTQSTDGIVDTYEGALALPVSGRGTLKIGLSHLFALNNSNAKVSAGRIIGNVPGTVFGNIFKDNVSGWGLIVESDEEIPIDVTFSFSLEREEFINRITLLHYGESTQDINIQTSVDSYNLKSIPGYSDKIRLSTQSALVSLDFNDTLVEYLHVTLSKNAADQSIDLDGKRVYRYIFGLRNIGIFITGRATSGTYISKPFDFSNDLSSIGKISISADERIHDETDIRWSVGLIDGNGELVGNYMSISPESRNDNSGSSKVINVQDSIKNKSNFISTDGTYSSPFTFNSIDFYKINTITKEPIFGTTKLYRGYRAWSRDTNGNFNPVLVKDNFLPFSKGNTQTLYAVKTESSVIQATAGSLTDRVLLLSDYPIYDTNKGHNLVPSSSVNPSKDTAPNYAIYSISQSVGEVAKSKVGVTFASNEESLGQPNILYNSSSDILVKDVIYNPGVGQTVGQVVRQFVDGRDYIVELDSNNYPTGKIKLTDNGTIAAGPQYAGVSRLEIHYTTDPNLLRFVSNIQNQQVFLKFEPALESTLLIANEQIFVKYRYKPQDVIKSSIKVKALFGAAGDSKIYKQGIDYIFDTSSSTIQRLTTGNIPDSSDVYIDYKYNDVPEQVHQFFLWALVTNSNGSEIRIETKGTGSLNNINKLNPNVNAGESFSANIPGIGLVDLTNAIQWPKMSGWIQFVVKSRVPEDLLNTSQIPLINQVILLKDNARDFIFIQGGKYFTELTAIREPLRQVSLPYLKTNTLKNDNSVFAIRELTVDGVKEYQVITNFEPNESTGLYQYVPDQDTGFLIYNPEEWQLVWSSRETSDALTSVVVKCSLVRNNLTEGSITPKVYGYFLKIGY